MQKNSWIFIGFAFVMGAFSLFLRWLQLLNSFEEETGLFVSGTSSSAALMIALMIAFAGLIYLTQPLRRLTAENCSNALKAKSVIIPVVVGVFCAVMFSGAVGLFASASATKYPQIYRVLALLGIISAACIYTAVYSLSLGKNGPMVCLCMAAVTLFYCFWLIVSYKEHDADPVVWDYAIEILAIAASLLGWYFTAGFAFERPKPSLSLFFQGLCFILCLCTLPDERSTFLSLMLIAPSAALLVLSWLQLSNLSPEPYKKKH